MAPTAPRPQPDYTDRLYRPHWDGLAKGIFLVQRWQPGGELQWPPTLMNGANQSTKFDWAPVALEGIVYTHTVSYRAFHPWFADHVPYAIIVVEVADRIRLTGNRFGEGLDAIRCGQRVTGRLVAAQDGSINLEW